jgi:hypothetical protein
MYYNTTNEVGEVLRNLKEKALTQEEIILSIFKLYPNKPLSPDDIELFFKENGQMFGPITSIRRAITNLANRKLLIKTSHKKMGSYGRHNYCWVYEDINEVL